MFQKLFVSLHKQNNKGMKKLQLRQVGDKVHFGAYGDFSDCNKIYEIKHVHECELFLGGVQYHLEDNEGHSVVAFSDEVRLIN